MRLAYIILAHKNPEQLVRLVRKLQLGDMTSFFIHIDKRAGESVAQQVGQELSDIANVYILKQYKCWWGDFNIVKATIEGIQTLLNSGVDFDYACLLSGQDYPIKSNARIQEFLYQNQGKEFISFAPLTEPNRFSEMEGCHQAMHRVLYQHFYFRSKVVCLPIKRSFPKGFEPCGDAQWWCLSRACIEYIGQTIHQHPEFVNYFKSVFIPDETFFQSLLSTSPFRDKITNDDLKYLDMENPNPNCPRILHLDTDWEKIMQSPKLFARKFDTARDSKILDAIDQEILGHCFA